MITIADIEAARRRIASHVRRTPIMQLAQTRDRLAPAQRVTLKLECLQAAGSFKARGAMNRLLGIEGKAAEGRARHGVGRQSRPCGRAHGLRRRHPGHGLPAAHRLARKGREAERMEGARSRSSAMSSIMPTPPPWIIPARPARSISIPLPTLSWWPAKARSASTSSTTSPMSTRSSSRSAAAA